MPLMSVSGGRANDACDVAGFPGLKASSALSTVGLAADGPLPDGETSDRPIPARDGAALPQRLVSACGPPLLEHTPGGVAVGFGGHGDVPPKDRGEVTLVRVPNLGP